MDMAYDGLVPPLPVEIIEFQILSRLPVKTLLRFRSVCKSWKLLISSDPNFIKTHLCNSNYNSVMLRCRLKIEDTTGNNSILQEDTTIIGCINGLVCLFNLQFKYLRKIMEIAIWNPATKRHMKIPDLVNKPDGMQYCAGFGFDMVANDYKIMYAATSREQPLVGNIYSCNAVCWRKIAPSNFCPRGYLLNFKQPATINGSLYWLNLQTEYNAKRRLTVISFDVRHEVFRLLPDSFEKESGMDVALMKMRDSVAVIFYDWALFLGSAVDVHIFDDRCSLWNKMTIGPFIGKKPKFLLAQKLLTCFTNGDILFAGPDLNLYCVNPKTHTIKRLKSPKRKGNKCNYYYDGCTYSESLIIIKGMKKPLDGHQVEIFNLEKD